MPPAGALVVSRTGNAVRKAMQAWSSGGPTLAAGPGALPAPSRRSVKRARVNDAEDSFQRMVSAHKQRLYAGSGDAGSEGPAWLA